MDIEELKSGKVKLEFGNQEQINIIDKHINLIELENDEETLKEYRVLFSVLGSIEIFVEAHDKEEARELAENEKYGYSSLDLDIEDIDFIECTPIGKIIK